MSKADKFFEIIGLGAKNNKDEYNDDYFEDDFDDEEQPAAKKSSGNDNRSRYAHRREVLDDSNDEASSYNDTYSAPRGTTQGRGRVAAMRGGNSGANNKTLIIHSPKAYEDSQMLAFQLKQNKQIIVKFDNVDQLLAQRILDFLSGTSFALGYKSYKISSGIILFAPSEINVEEQDEREQNEADQDDIYSMDDIRRR